MSDSDGADVAGGARACDLLGTHSDRRLDLRRRPMASFLALQEWSAREKAGEDTGRQGVCECVCVCVRECVTRNIWLAWEYM